MRMLVTVVQEGGEPHDVVIATDDMATAGDVAEVLGAALGQPAPHPGHGAGNVVQMPGTTAVPMPGYGAAATRAPSLWADGLYCDPEAPAATVLRDGMRVSVDDSIGPLLRKGEPVGQYELRVAGGPAAGRVVRLGVGAATVGSAPTCTLPVSDPSLPQVALRVTIDLQGDTKVSAEGGAEVLLDDEAVETAASWPLGGVVRIGDSLLVLDRVAEPDAHLSLMSEGGLAYNRPPRLSPLRPRRRLVVPVPPGKGRRPSSSSSWRSCPCSSVWACTSSPNRSTCWRSAS